MASEFPQSPPSNSITLDSVIRNDPILYNYFMTQIHSTSDSKQTNELAEQLMMDGIRYRTGSLKYDHKQVIDAKMKQEQTLLATEPKMPQKSGIKPLTSSLNKHNRNHNVTQTRHNIYLSPKQKRQYITPKVTETVPVQSPHVIYGKPKIYVDQQCGCPYHDYQEQCIEQGQIRLQRSHSGRKNTSKPRVLIKEIHLKQKQSDCKNNKTQFVPELSHSFGSPQKSHSNENPKTHDPHDNAEKSQGNENCQTVPKSPQKVKNLKTNKKKVSPCKSKRKSMDRQIIIVQGIKQVRSRVPGLVRTVKSPNSYSNRHNTSDDDSQDDAVGCYDEYLTAKNFKKTKSNKHQISSRIKPLIQKDKRKKQLQKQMRKQQSRIQQMQQQLKKIKRNNFKPASNDGSFDLSSESNFSSFAPEGRSRGINREIDQRNGNHVKLVVQDADESSFFCDCDCSQSLESLSGL